MTVRPTRATRAVLALAAAAALSVTAGCGAEPLQSDVHPGAAAVIDGESISIGDVDDLTERYCDFAAAQLRSQGQQVPMSLVRNASLNLLVQRQIAEDYAAAHDIDLAPARRLMEQQATQQADQQQVPEKDRAIFNQVQLQLDASIVYLAAGGADAFATGQMPSQDALNAGYALVTDWAKELKVSYDPRFSDIAAEKYDVNTTTLSSPASELAKLSAAFDPNQQAEAAYLDSLPTDQKCG